MPGPATAPGQGPNNPTAAQLAQLATYQATLTAAQATLAASYTSHSSAQLAVQVAIQALENYRAYIYGAAPKSKVLDEGGPSVT